MNSIWDEHATSIYNVYTLVSIKYRKASHLTKTNKNVQHMVCKKYEKWHRLKSITGLVDVFVLSLWNIGYITHNDSYNSHTILNTLKKKALSQHTSSFALICIKMGLKDIKICNANTTLKIITFVVLRKEWFCSCCVGWPLRLSSCKHGEYFLFSVSHALFTAPQTQRNNTEDIQTRTLCIRAQWRHIEHLLPRCVNKRPL